MTPVSTVSTVSRVCRESVEGVEPGLKCSSTLQPWPERSGPRGIGMHHAGAELEPAKGDSGVKR